MIPLRHFLLPLLIGPLAVAGWSVTPVPLPSGDGLAPAVVAPDLRPARATPVTPSGTAFEPGHLSFRLRFGDRAIRYRTMAAIVLPGERVEIAVDGVDGLPVFRHEAGVANSLGSGRWEWTAPREPGVYATRVDVPGGETATVNVFVSHPRELVRNGSLHGYRIGSYREEPLRGLETYLPPNGFIEVRPEDVDLLVSPHFTLGQFLCKQMGARRFVSVTPALLEKLERILEATNQAGHAAPTFHVMSGFRTPAYNRAIGNTTDYSRHLWGDAADIFVDADGDRDMDDLNGDGRSNLDDARILYRIVERVERRTPGDVHEGGLGLYRRNSAHGPFVHVDARGYTARW